MLPLLYLSLLLIPSFQIDQSKTIIIFFSRAGENYNVGNVEIGNTEMIVNYLKEVTNITSYKIIPVTAYPTNYQETVTIAQNEKNTNARPAIQNPLTDISKYDNILLGYPIWHGNIPNIVMTLLESLNFEGKTIYPFNTHGGSGLGNSINDIKNLAPKANVKDGFPLSGTYARTTEAHEDINDWLKDKLEIDNTAIDSTTIGNTKIDSTAIDSDNDDDDDDNIPTVRARGKFLKITFLLVLSVFDFI